MDSLVISGIGVSSAVGLGKAAFYAALLAAEHRFCVMQRPGRQCETAFIGAELPPMDPPAGLPASIIRTASLSAKTALTTLSEAWSDAQLSGFGGDKIGLIVGGSNVQQRDSMLLREQHQTNPEFLRPSYGLSFWDTDLCGLCTAAFGIRGRSYSVGASSASGQLAIIAAAEAVAAGQVDACIALGALCDISYWECQAFRALGAMGSDRYADAPALACRPFDSSRDGFIYGEACGALVVEREGACSKRGVTPYARLASWSTVVDANRNPNPSLEGEMIVIRQAIDRMGIKPSRIDYINPHGSGSVIGDKTELQAIRNSGLGHVAINATKSIVGHSLTAAGTVEAAATLLQMQEGWLHPTRNLAEPIDEAFNWVGASKMRLNIRSALSLSFGFGGINTAIGWSKL